MRDTIKPCSSCGTDIHLLLNVSTSRWMRVDVAPHPVGNVAVDVYRATCQVLTGDLLTKARAIPQELHLAHHVTCEKADAHRKPHVDNQTLFNPEEATP